MASDMQAVNGDAATEKPTEVVTFLAMKVVIEVARKKAEAAADFYKKTFGAEEVKRMECRKRKNDQEHPLIVSAELKIGSDSFLISDSEDETVNGSGMLLRLETDNVNRAIARAVECGATQEGEIKEEEDGGIFAKLKEDPFGTVWIVASAAAKKNCTKEKPEAEPESLTEAAAATEAPPAA